MTNEEKKAVERLRNTSKQCHNSKECWENENCPDCYVEVEDIMAIDTVLKILEKQDNRIKKLESDKEIKDKMIELIKNRIFLTVDECEKIKEIENRSVSKSWENSVVKYFENLAKESGEIDEC